MPELTKNEKKFIAKITAAGINESKRKEIVSAEFGEEKFGELVSKLEKMQTGKELFIAAWAYDSGVGKKTDKKKAEKLYKGAIAADPKNSAAKNNLAGLYEDQGKTAKAEILYKGVIADDPENSDAKYNLALLYKDQGKTAEAEILYKEAIAADPENSDAKNNLAGLYVDQGKTAEAEILYKEVIAADPKSSDAKNNLAVLYANQGETAKAEILYKEVIAADPKSSDAKNNLALLYAKNPALGDLKSNIEFFVESLNDSPQENKYITSIKSNFYKYIKAQDSKDLSAVLLVITGNVPASADLSKPDIKNDKYFPLFEAVESNDKENRSKWDKLRNKPSLLDKTNQIQKSEAGKENTGENTIDTVETPEKKKVRSDRIKGKTRYGNDRTPLLAAAETNDTGWVAAVSFANAIETNDLLSPAAEKALDELKVCPAVPNDPFAKASAPSLISWEKRVAVPEKREQILALG